MYQPCKLIDVLNYAVEGRLGSAAGAFLHPAIHEIGLVLAILFGLIALGRGIWKHGYMLPSAVGAFGLGMMAVIRLRTTHEHIRACIKQFSEMPQVIEVLRLTGEDCFLLKVLVPSPGELETIVDTIARYGAVTTSLVLRGEPPKPIGRALIQRA